MLKMQGKDEQQENIKMKKQVSISFKKLIEKYSPKNILWKKLVRYTRHNGNITKEREKVQSGGFYINGAKIIKTENDEYEFKSRTIENGREKWNSYAKFDKDYNFIEGTINMFTSECPDNGEYHNKLFKELLKKEDFVWDLIE
jgi:hypothetical protein